MLARWILLALAGAQGDDVAMLQLRATSGESEVTSATSAADASSALSVLHTDAVFKPNGTQPMVSCAKLRQGSLSTASVADGDLQHALATFCEVGLGHFAEFRTDPRFALTEARLRGDDGWIDRAYVTYFGMTTPDDPRGKWLDLLLQSVHHFSKEPIVVANFGSWLPEEWTPERFPNLLIVHGSSVPGSFNFNKFTTMLFTKVKSGLALDVDQFVNQGLDSLLKQAAVETTSAYPFPIMPAHWMSRDPESGDMTEVNPKGYPYSFLFKSKQAPKRTMRWGHAHPTWSYQALPFLARWTSYALVGRHAGAPGWFLEQGPLEDEDVLNVALWAENATKQWCKYDIPTVEMFDMFLDHGKEHGNMLADSKFYPKGVPLVFFTAHGAKNATASFEMLRRLWKNDGPGASKTIYYNGNWFDSNTDLKAFDPSLPCVA